MSADLGFVDTWLVVVVVPDEGMTMVEMPVLLVKGLTVAIMLAVTVGLTVSNFDVENLSTIINIQRLKQESSRNYCRKKGMI